MKHAPIPNNEAERLQALYRLNILDSEPEQRFERLTRLAQLLFDVPIVLVSLIDQDRQWFKSSQGIDQCELKRDISFCGHAIMDDDIFEIEDARQHPDFIDNPLVTGAPYIRFYAGVPLVTSQGFAIGTLCIIDTQPRRLSDEQRLALTDLANSVLSEIELVDVYKQNQDYKAIQELTQTITRAQAHFIVDGNRQATFDKLLADILQLTQSEYGFIGEVLFNQQGQPYLKNYALTNISWDDDTRNFYEKHAPSGMEFYNLDTLFGAVMKTEQPVIANDPKNDPRAGGLPKGHPALDAFLGIPIHYANKLVAMVGLANRPNGYSQQTIEYLAPLMSTIGQLVSSVRIREQQNALQASLVQFKNTVDQALDCIFMFDADSLQFIYCNQGAIEHIGYTQQELLTMSPLDIDPNFSEDRARNMLNQLIQGDQKSTKFRTTHRAKSGTIIDVEVVLQYVDKGDQNAHCLCFVRDIRDRLAYEKAIEEVKERLRRGQEYANLGTWEWNMVSGDLYWTEQIAPLFGYAKGELETTYENFLAAIHPDDRQAVTDAVTACVEQKDPYDIQHRVVWPDGTVRWLHEKGDVQRDANGAPITMIGVVQDITELKDSEKNLKIFQRIFDTTEQGIGLTDAQGVLIYSNPAHDRLHGYQPGECIGKHFSVFLSEDTMKTKGEEILSAVSQGKNWSGYLPIVQKDGQALITSSSVGSIADEDNKPQYLFNIMTDYSSELNRQQQLKLAKEEAERANLAKSEFLSSMSHELRTPLNSIIGFSQLLELSELSQKQKQQLNTIKNSGKHLLSLINDVLEFAKIESGKLTLNLQPVETQTTLKTVVELCQSEANRSAIDIDLMPSDTPIFIQADPVRFQQVLLNLVSNAIKYNRQHGKIWLSWNIVTKQTGEFWQLSVKDTGMGIAEQDFSRLFEPFDRLGHETSAIEGTGIGLTIVKDLVEQMGGTIEVESQLGVGTSFHVCMPIEATATNLAPSSSSSQKPSQPAQNNEQAASSLQSPLKILYVEDNPANMTLMAQIGQLIENIEFRIAPTAENGLQQAQAWKPDLILLDINLPGMNGDQAIEHFRNLAHATDLAPSIFAVTANALDDQVTRYHQLGFDQVIAKPFDIQQIIQLVEQEKQKRF